MPPRLSCVAAAVGVAVALVAGCDDSTTQRHPADTQGYSGMRFKRCIERDQSDVISLVGGKGYTATSMMWATFGEWVYFYGSAEAASAERLRLKSETAPRWRVWRQLLRTQRSNTLVFAPVRKDWLSPIKGCLEQARD